MSVAGEPAAPRFLGPVRGTSDAASCSADAERRSVGRSRCVLTCSITHGIWSEVVEGVVRDLHEDGARLRLRTTASIRGLVRLRVPLARDVYLATVIWQRGNDLGVKLLATPEESANQQVEILRLAGAQLRRREPGNQV